MTTELARRSRDAAEADAAYKCAYAKAYLAAEGKTVAEREAHAVLEVADAYLRRRIAEALQLAAQEAGRNYRAQLDALRSIGASVRFAIQNASGYGA